MADTASVPDASFLWRRLPACLADVCHAPPVTQYLPTRFHSTMANLDSTKFAHEPLPWLRGSEERLASYQKQYSAACWKRMSTDRYEEHQCPDMPAYSVLLAPSIPGAVEYRQSLRPFGEKLLLAVIGARFGLGGWFGALRGWAVEFRNWC